LQSEYADYQSSTNEGEATQPDLSRQMLGSYSTLDAVTRDAKRSLSAGLFLPYLLQENLIGNMASTRGQR
jgi:hypothetical protein